MAFGDSVQHITEQPELFARHGVVDLVADGEVREDVGAADIGERGDLRDGVRGLFGQQAEAAHAGVELDHYVERAALADGLLAEHPRDFERRDARDHAEMHDVRDLGVQQSAEQTDVFPEGDDLEGFRRSRHAERRGVVAERPRDLDRAQVVGVRLDDREERGGRNRPCERTVVALQRAEVDFEPDSVGHDPESPSASDHLWYSCRDLGSLSAFARTASMPIAVALAAAMVVMYGMRFWMALRRM